MEGREKRRKHAGKRVREVDKWKGSKGADSRGFINHAQYTIVASSESPPRVAVVAAADAQVNRSSFFRLCIRRLSVVNLQR